MEILNVLVVEDDADLRFLIGDIFRDVGCSVRDAEHGQQALDVLEGWRPDVIVLDVAMPVMDGFTFLRPSGEYPTQGKLIRYVLDLLKAEYPMHAVGLGEPPGVRTGGSREAR